MVCLTRCISHLFIIGESPLVIYICKLLPNLTFSQVAITGDVMYSDPQTQHDLMELHQKFENMTYIAGPLYTESWIRAWLGFLDRNQDYLGLNVTTEEDFIANLREVIFITFFLTSYFLISVILIFVLSFTSHFSLLSLHDFIE